jgi:predicted dehydrogenase
MLTGNGMEELRVGVVGVGHLGKEHARVYAQMPGVRLVGVADSDESRARSVARKWSTDSFADYHVLLDRVDAVSVVVPTRFHFEVARQFLDRGIAALVEKPMTRTIAEGEALVEAARKSGATLQVGHIERFNPAMVAIQKFPLRPRFIEVHRLAPFSFRSGDIGVVLDLMIHDLDIILHLVGSEVERVDAVGVSVLAEREDIANARLVFRNGCVANVTASRVSARAMRKIRLFSDDCYISLDYGERQALIYRKSLRLASGAVKLEDVDITRIADLKKFLFGDLLTIEKVAMDDFEPLQKELASFVDCVRHRKPPVVGGEQAMNAIRVAWRILDDIAASLKRANVPVPPGLAAGDYERQGKPAQDSRSSPGI